MIKICFLDAETLGQISLAPLYELGDITIYNQTNPSETSTRISGNEVVITNKVIIGKETMLANPQLKLICVAATGMNNIDLVASSELGIEVKNVKGYSTQSVAQVTFSLLFSLLTKVNYFDHYVKSGQYADSHHFSHFGHEFWQLAGKTFGIIGMGEIGRKVAEIAQVFGCEVIYNSTSGKNKNQPFEAVQLDDLLKRADIVSIHSPLNSETENLITYEKIKIMKSSAFLINVGRGGIVNEGGLAKALEEKLIAGAAIDVFTKEPILQENPLMKLVNKENLILTPHIAWASIEAREKLLEGICEHIKNAFPTKI